MRHADGPALMIDNFDDRPRSRVVALYYVARENPRVSGSHAVGGFAIYLDLSHRDDLPLHGHSCPLNFVRVWKCAQAILPVPDWRINASPEAARCDLRWKGESKISSRTRGR